MKTMTHEEFLAEARRRFGEDPKKWKVVCPACGTVQSIQQFIDAGVSAEDISSCFAFSCIGRFTKQGDAGITAHHRNQPWDKGCNWTLGGLLRIHTLEVVIDGHNRMTFELAEP